MKTNYLNFRIPIYDIPNMKKEITKEEIGDYKN